MGICGISDQEVTTWFSPLGPLDLVAGKYSFTLAIADKQTKRALIRSRGLHEFRVFADKAHWGRVVRPIVAS